MPSAAALARACGGEAGRAALVAAAGCDGSLGRSGVGVRGTRAGQDITSAPRRPSGLGPLAKHNGPKHCGGNTTSVFSVNQG